MQRVIGGFVTFFEDAVSKLENHDAQIKSSLREIESATIRLRQYQRVLLQDLTAAQAQEVLSNEESAKWLRRAKDLKVSDREKALDCLRRAQDEERKRVQQFEKIAVTKDRIEQTDQELSRLEVMRGQIRHRRNELRSRASRAGVGATSGDHVGERIEEIFARWELHVGEVDSSSQSESDPLKIDFEEKEKLAALEEQLELL
jgi:hypothetical protein